MSIDELFSFIREELKGCNNYQFIDRVLAELRIEIEKRQFFDAEKFKSWFIDRDVIYKNNPIAFLKKCGSEDIKKGTFDKEIITKLNHLPVALEMKRRHITYESEDFDRLSVYFLYLYNNGYMTLDEISTWLFNAICYVEISTKKASTIKELFKKSKTMKKFHLPYEELEKQVKEIAENEN